MEEKEQGKQIYPIDERCANCSLFLVIEEQGQEIKRLREELEDLKKQLNKPQKGMSNSSIPS